MRDIEKLPGNARIAGALLDLLVAAGDAAARERVERALGDVGSLGRRRADWIQTELLRKAFREAPAYPRLARREGHALAAPRQIGLLLFHAGVATPEKAYRRVDQLLARERPGDRFEATSIGKGRATIEFHPERCSDGDALFCAVRTGMLESMPTHYGLPPATIREIACAHRGASCCVFEAEWRLSSRTGLAIGAGVGAAVGVASGLALSATAVAAAWLPLPIVLALALLGGAAGRSVDLARQLDAMARGRLGQLALVDQMDVVVAEKMDALAKLAAPGDAPPAVAGGNAREHSAVDEDAIDTAASSRPPADLLRRFQHALGSLQRGLAALQTGSELRGSQRVDPCAEAALDLHAIGFELSQAAERAGGERQPADLATIVRRGVVAVRASLPGSLELDLRVPADRAPILCHPFQLEQVVIQLLKNASQAMRGVGRVEVVLGPSPDGFELAIRDEGQGIAPDILDRVFDPFSATPQPGSDDGPESDLGLGDCQRIVHRHGGELSVQSEQGLGTRVALILPANWPSGAA